LQKFSKIGLRQVADTLILHHRCPPIAEITAVFRIKKTISRIAWKTRSNDIFCALVA